jgi:hypothetical protein
MSTVSVGICLLSVRATVIALAVPACGPLRMFLSSPPDVVLTGAHSLVQSPGLSSVFSAGDRRPAPGARGSDHGVSGA